MSKGIWDSNTEQFDFSDLVESIRDINGRIHEIENINEFIQDEIEKNVEMALKEYIEDGLFVQIYGCEQDCINISLHSTHDQIVEKNINIINLLEDYRFYDVIEDENCDSILDGLELTFNKAISILKEARNARNKHNQH